MTATIERTSVERLEIMVISDEPLAGATVEFQFLPAGAQPDPGDWEVGVVGESSEVGCDVFQTQVQTPLIGPGNLVVPPGSWVVWVRVTSGAEMPVMKDGTLVVL